MAKLNFCVVIQFSVRLRIVCMRIYLDAYFTVDGNGWPSEVVKTSVTVRKMIHSLNVFANCQRHLATHTAAATGLYRPQKCVKQSR